MKKNITQIIGKVDSLNLRGVNDVYIGLDNVFSKTIEDVLYDIETFSHLQELIDALLDTYKRNRLWFAFEICLYLNAEAEDMHIDNLKMLEKYSYFKPFNKLNRIKNMNLVPTKKENLIKNIKCVVHTYLSDSELKNNFIKIINDKQKEVA